MEEAEPSGLGGGVRLKPYQRQSLAFMLSVETSDDASLAGSDGRRGGWLADEVGMGKTMVAISLILAHPPPADATNSRRTTLVVVPNSLAGQWADELARFAPSLKTAMYYGAR